MPRNWRFRLHDAGVTDSLSRELRCSSLMARVLHARGYEAADQAREFLAAKLTDLHEPSLLPGVEEATARVIAALKAKRRITIYGDYDVDGVTSTSILWHCLTLAGGKVDYYIPCRLEEGYGVNREALKQLYEDDPDRLLITVDCGIASVAEAAFARELGLELIITDHHQFAEELPPAACLVHPRLPGSQYPFGELCGAGVAFKLAWSICQQLGDGKKASPHMREFLKEAVTLAAIGTVADVVPLVGENRMLVRYGLTTLPQFKGIGLRALMKTGDLLNRPNYTAEDIGFGISPRINAAGRLGQARLAVELLTTDKPDRAMQLAEYLDQLNKQRQTVERRIFKQAKELVEQDDFWADAPALVLDHEDWHPGVIGIVANRVAEHFEKPTILVSFQQNGEMGQASGRSFNGYNMHAGVTHCGEFLEAFGGHHAAVGLKVTKEKLDDFRTAFCNHVANATPGEQTESELVIDAEVPFTELTLPAVESLEQLGPFGKDNDRPLFAAADCELVEPPKKMGGGERHLSVLVRQHGRVLRGVAFGKADWADEMQTSGSSLSVCFRPNINHFRGQQNVEIQLVDWKPVTNGHTE